jgi:hypothetical protein
MFAIFVTLILLFNAVRAGYVLEYRARGRWIDPAFAERLYLMLSLVAKSLLACQVYAGAPGGSRVRAKRCRRVRVPLMAGVTIYATGPSTSRRRERGRPCSHSR